MKTTSKIWHYPLRSINRHEGIFEGGCVKINNMRPFYGKTTQWMFLFFAIIATFNVEARLQTEVVFDEQDTWDAKQKEFIKKAANTAMDRLRSFEIAQCAYRNTFRGPYTKEKLRKKL